MIGETVSHYRVLRHLGAGGMGDVYLAENLRLGLKVALKFLPTELTRDRQALQRFRTEARASAELSHPHIAQIHDLEEEHGRPFLVLEYLEGETLRDRLNQGPLSVEEALRIGKALADGLAHAHSKGIVHRDIKGANVILTPDGGVKILDFGLARHVDATHVTRTGAILGTVAYMSPEQVQGKEADARSDLWSLGVVMYECLTGRLPFEGESSQSVMHGIASTSPSPPTALRTGIPMELEQVVLRCLEKDPTLRYQHADDLVAELRRIESRTAASIPSGLGVGGGETRPRWRVIAMGVGVFVVLATLVGITHRIGWIPGRGESPGELQVEPSVALVDVRNLSNPEDALPSAMMTNLLEVGLIEASPCRVVSLEYLKDLRRRMFESVVGPIGPDEALEIARAAGASSLLFCDVTDLEGQRVLLWRLVDTATGKALGAQRVEGSAFADLADSTVSGVLPFLAAAAGVEGPIAASVREMTTSSPRAYRHFTAAKLAMQQGRHDIASQELSKATAVDSTFALAYLEYATYRVYARPRDIIEDSIEKAWSFRDRLSIKDRLRLEALRAQNGNPKESIKTYREILSRWPDDRDAIVDLHNVLLRFWGAPEELLALAERGIAHYPDDERMLGLYESSLSGVGRHEESIAAIRAFLLRNPETANLVSRIGGTFLYGMALADSAEVYFGRALELDPSDPETWRMFVHCSYMRGDLGTAIGRSARILDIKDLAMEIRLDVIVNTFGWPELAQLYAEAGRVEKAFELMKEAEKYTSGPADLRFVESCRNRLRLRVGRAEEVLQSADGWSEGHPGRWLTRLRGLTALDSLDAATAALESVLSRPEASEKWWFYYTRKIEADIALALGKPEETLRILLPETRPSQGMQDVDKRESIVRAYRMLGRHEEAEDALREILRWYGGHAVAHYELGQVLEKMGRVEEAESEYERFLEMWSDADDGLPQFVDAKRRLAALR